MGTAIPASILYSSARTPEDLMKARSFDADLWLIDLEDSVPAVERPQARDAVNTFLSADIDLSRTAVRINPLSSLDYCEDVLMLSGSPNRPDYVFMTMVERPIEVTLLRRALAQVDWYPFVYVTIETPDAVENIRAIAENSDGMILGSADLAASLGVEISAKALSSTRQAMALAAAGQNIGCIDTGNFRLSDGASLDGEIFEAKALGFHGKGTVHPKELVEINKTFRPTDAMRVEAKRVCDAYEEARGGVCMLDGKMIGPPFARLAQNKLQRAQDWEDRFGST